MYYKDVHVKKECDGLPRIVCIGSTSQELAKYKLEISNQSGVLLLYEKVNKNKTDYMWIMIYAASNYQVFFSNNSLLDDK